jgi:hydroxypyruvate isomerase
MIVNLRWAAEIVASEGLTLCLEPMNARTLKGMLLAHFDDGCGIARATGHAAVRMIFDTAHVQSMDGDLIGHMERNWDLIQIVIRLQTIPAALSPRSARSICKRYLGKFENSAIAVSSSWSTSGRRPNWTSKGVG